MKQSLGIVIPVYNEELVLPLLFERLQSIYQTANYQLFVVFVDDGSVDKSWEMLDDFCSKNSFASGIKLSRNFGHQVAVSAGLSHSEFDYIGVMDADLQDPPEFFQNMLSKAVEGYDVVYAVRKNRKESVFLKSAYWIFYRLLKNVANIDLALDAGDFCLMSKAVVQQLNLMPEHNRFVRGLRGWVGFRQIGIPYERAGRAAGETKYPLTKLISLAMDGLISFSSLPLKISGWLGFLAAFLGVIYLSIEFVKFFLFQKPPNGWASMIGVVIFFGGVQLLMLGIIGQYLGRVFDEVKQRPIFVAEKKTGFLANK